VLRSELSRIFRIRPQDEPPISADSMGDSGPTEKAAG
jgi:hypothetical protein